MSAERMEEEFEQMMKEHDEHQQTGKQKDVENRASKTRKERKSPTSEKS